MAADDPVADRGLACLIEHPEENPLLAIDEFLGEAFHRDHSVRQHHGPELPAESRDTPRVTLEALIDDGGERQCLSGTAVQDDVG